MGEFVKVATRSELPDEGEAREFLAGGTLVCIANINGAYTAMDNVCVHRGGPLGQGIVLDGKLVCPWHGWAFDPQTGAADQNPNLCVPVYVMKIEGEDVLVRPSANHTAEAVR